MQILVYSVRNESFSNFDWERHVKTIKGSLEMANVNYTTLHLGGYEIAHLTTPLMDNRLNEVYEQNKLIVISALYTENDAYGSFLELDSSENKFEANISNKTVTFLNKANLILVPNERATEFLQNNGVTTPIKVVIPGVNLSRFAYSSDDEKDIFYRYFKEDRNRKIVIARGEFQKTADGLGAFINAAKKSPNVAFYYLANSETNKKVTLSIKRKMKEAPKNAHFFINVPYDVYKSALINAEILLLPGYNPPSIINVLDGMAAKCQIISRKHNILEGYIENEVTGYTAEYSETLGILVREVLNGDIKPTTEKAYEFVQDKTLEKYGEQLKEIYNELIKQK